MVMVMFPQNCLACNLYLNTCMRGKLVVMYLLEPMAATCNTRYWICTAPSGEEQIMFICATGSEGRSARSTAVYTIHDLVPLPAYTREQLKLLVWV